MQWTHEQHPIIHSTANKLLIQAFAGTGKTTTLVGYVEHHATVQLLYLCYNKLVELAARELGDAALDKNYRGVSGSLTANPGAALLHCG